LVIMSLLKSKNFSLLLVLTSPLHHSALANDNVFVKAKACQQKCVVWVDNRCVIEIEGETPANTPDAAPPTPKPSETVVATSAPGTQNPATRRNLISLAVGHSLQQSNGNIKINAWGTPDPFYTWDANGYTGPYDAGSATAGFSTKYSNEVSLSLVWASMKRNDIGFAVDISHYPAASIEIENGSQSGSNDKLSRINLSAQVLYSIGAEGGTDFMISPFLGIHYPLGGEFESGSKEANVDAFHINTGKEYGFKMTLNRHYQIDLLYRQTDWSVKLSQSVQGQFAKRNPDGTFTRVSEVVAYAQAKETLKEQLIKLVYLF